MLYALITSPMSATCPAHLILLALITLIILGLSTDYMNTARECAAHRPVISQMGFTAMPIAE
jgi:hypothetical protein